MYNIGNLKSLLLLWEYLASNQRYEPYVCKKDIESFRTRAQNEGLHFLTVVLPSIGKALDSFFATGDFVSPSGFDSHHRVISDASLAGCSKMTIPIFLGNAVECALAGDSSAVDCVRQLTYVFYKLEVEYDSALVEDFLSSFIRTDESLLSIFSEPDEDRDEHVGIMARIVKRVLCNTDPRNIRPCHGSGATACRTENKDKWHTIRFDTELDAVYPYADYFFFSPTHLSDELDRLENSAYLTPKARVVLVPKDSRGPRIISCEPAEYMYIQQGIMRSMYQTLETHSMTRGQINFLDQTINRNLARQGSIDGILATLDMSEASDRVSLELVRRVFPPNWFECLGACRSKFTVLPDGRELKLNKFAPMGSSCCFPVEALVFWASCQATFRRIGIKSKAYVYGDDIIIPAAYAAEIVRDLESIGLVINVTKSFTRGPFRESCGGDYHKGDDVTPIRVRHGLGTSRTSIATDADLANLLIAKFGYKDSIPLIDLIEKENGYVYPRTELCIPCTIRYSPRASNDAFFRRRWNLHLQRFEHRVLGLFTEALALREKAWCELLRKELTLECNSDTTGDVPVWVKPQTSMDPGSYAATRSAKQKWAWTWIG